MIGDGRNAKHEAGRMWKKDWGDVEKFGRLSGCYHMELCGRLVLGLVVGRPMVLKMGWGS